MNTIEKCRCCQKDIDITIPRGYAKWTVADSSISLPAPPDDINGAFICDACYVDGPTLEARIRLADNNKKPLGNITGSINSVVDNAVWNSIGGINNNIPPISAGDTNGTGSAKTSPPEPIPEPKAKSAKNEIDYWNQPYPKMGQKFR